MHISDLDYELPQELIAQQPLEQRDASRMLILDRAQGTWRDSHFAELPSCLKEGDALVINNTRVFPARLVGERDPSGGQVEFLLLREIEPAVWEALARPARRLRVGARVRFGSSDLRGEVLASVDDEVRIVRFVCTEGLQVLDQIGQTPLPPYIRRPAGPSEADRERYQTVYASQKGAIAAPTAGLHFTGRLLDELVSRGVQIAEVTLHVGYGTFEPVRVEEISRHHVAPERFEISKQAADAINKARAGGGQVLAVGTTTTRALESAARKDLRVKPGAGVAQITIIPGHRFRIVDRLLTNFHLPRSSLLLLVSAFAGRDLVLAAYRHAVRARYRFYSYGDCMLIT